MIIKYRIPKIIPNEYPIAMPIRFREGTNKYQLITDEIKIIMPPMFGYKTYLVPDKNVISGTETIRRKTLGRIILNIWLPFENDGPKMANIVSEKMKRGTIIKREIAVRDAIVYLSVFIIKA